MTCATPSAAGGCGSPARSSSIAARPAVAAGVRRGARHPPGPSGGPTGEPWPPAHLQVRPWRGFGCLFGFAVRRSASSGCSSLGVRFVGDILAAPGPAGVVIRLAALLVLVAILAGSRPRRARDPEDRHASSTTSSGRRRGSRPATTPRGSRARSAFPIPSAT